MTVKFLPRILCNLNRRTRFKLFYEMRIPDKWLDYCRIGDRLDNLPFICFKTPLSKKFSCRNDPYSLHEDEEFTPNQLCKDLEKRNIKLGMVIDLTNTYRYYNGKAEFDERFGIRYTKIKFDGYNPNCFTEVYNIFSRCVKRFLVRAKPDEVIGVHCTHGVNRTGYIVCRYLIEEYNYSFEDAVELFNQARGHDMEKYLMPLKDIWLKKRAVAEKDHRPIPMSSSFDDEVSPFLRKRANIPIEPKGNLESLDLRENGGSPSFKEASLKERTLVELHDESWKRPPESFTNDSIDESSLLRFDEDDEDQKLAQRNAVL